MIRFKNRLLQTPLILYTGLGRLKTGSDRLRVDFHTGLGQVWTGLGRFGQA